MTTRIRLVYDAFTDTHQLFISQEREGKLYAGSVVFTELERGKYREPTLSVPCDDNIPTQLKNELKHMGLLHFADEATLKAKDYHLEDMRRLVFKDKK